jgi:NitT/TauT family transport system ATP-binding protein
VPAALAEIELREISHTFASRSGVTHAVTNIDLTVAAGEFVSILGASGCGKSTLLRIIGGLLEPTFGSALVRGRSTERCRHDKVFALAPQQPALLPWRTVRQNASLLTEVNRDPQQSTDPALVTQLLEEVGLSSAADAYPHELSGGMQQRVALVRAFALQAPVLLLDEPFAALDEITRADMRRLLLTLWTHHRSTAIFITHSLAEAALLSDRVVILGGTPGEIVAIEQIELPRPRSGEVEDSDAFDKQVRRLRALLRDGAAR